jgi:hypothetical protein
MKTKILNSEGKPIELNEQEARLALRNQELCNALGYEIDITTLTAISKRVVEQKFFEVMPADYMPVAVGNGAFSSEILTYREFSTGGDFETGLLNTGSDNARLANADTAIDGVKVPIMDWAKQVSWTLIDLKKAQVSGNWNLITAKERSRKKNWDLGIQRTAFLGLQNNTAVKGLLTQADVNANTTTITALLSGLSATDYATFVSKVYGDYRTNSAYTAKPTHFIIPETDYNGLITPFSSGFPNVSKFAYLLQAFKDITGNPNFKILPLAYAAKANNATVSGLNKNRYTLLNYDEDSLRMDIPVDYTNTLQNTVNGFQFQSAAYGEFTGLKAYRPLEMLYFDWG